MKWLCFSVGVFASASSGSETCSARYERFSSKKGRRSGGRVSTALPTMTRCALAPHAIVSRGVRDAISAMATQTRIAIAASVNCERREPRDVASMRLRFAHVRSRDAFPASATATSFDLRKLRNICNPLGLIRGAQRTLLATVEVVEHETSRQPHKESDPIHDGKPCHQKQAREDRDGRRERPAGSAEGALSIGFAIAKDQHAGSDECEGEQRADIG